MSCTHDCGCSQTVKDARTDDWGQIASESAREATQEPRTASDGTPAAPDACAPVSGPLPRQIKPEDVRPGMVIEQRKGEGLLRDRVIAIEDGTFKGDVVWLHGEDERNGWSFWLIEDAPEPVDPDAELVERMAKAIDAEPGFNVSDMAYAALRALREIRDVTARAEQ